MGFASVKRRLVIPKNSFHFKFTIHANNKINLNRHPASIADSSCQTRLMTTKYRQRIGMARSKS